MTAAIDFLFSFGFFTFVMASLTAVGIGVLALAGSDDFKIAKACFVGVGLYGGAELVYLAIKQGNWATFPLFALAVAACLWFCIEASRYVDRKHEDKLAKETRNDRDAAEEIRPFYDILTAEEKRVLRLILPLGRSPTNLNVRQLNALESIQQKAGFVGRNYTTGSYELNAKIIEPLKVLFSSEPVEALLTEGGDHSRAGQIESPQGLVISYNGGRYDHRKMDGEKILRHVIRLRLENRSERDIKDIRVKAESFQSQEALVQQVPLRIQHDDNFLKKNGFSLSPGEIEMIDVVERAADSDSIRLCAASERQFFTQEDEFRITVVVTAQEQSKQRKLLRVRKDKADLLGCDALKTKNEPTAPIDTKNRIVAAAVKALPEQASSQIVDHQQRIAGWREMIAEARNKFQESGLALIAILEQDSRFESFRRHLSTGALQALQSGTGVKAKDLRSFDDVITMLEDEIIRVEENWGLR